MDAINFADALIVAVPSSILVENRYLRSVLCSHSKACLASGGLAHDLVKLGVDCLRLYTKGVARIGKINREKNLFLVIKIIQIILCIHFSG